jgi:hypothetical protein
LCKKCGPVLLRNLVHDGVFRRATFIAKHSYFACSCGHCRRHAVATNVPTSVVTKLHAIVINYGNRLGEETYKVIFHKVVEQCKTVGLVKGERLMADGSTIAANASLYQMKERKSDSNDDEPKIKPGSGTGQRQSKDGLSNNDLKKHSIAGKKLANQTHYSPTDPDATLSGKHGEYKALRYKTHHMIDADSRVIVDCHVTTGAESEVTIFPERLDVVQKDLGNPIQGVIADRGYGSGKNLLLLKEKGIESNIPLWSTKVGHSFNKADGRFAFDRSTMTAKCPEGHSMKQLKNDNESAMFVVSKKICEICPQYLSCCSDAQRLNGRGKRIRIHHNQDIYNEVLEKEKNPMFKIKLRERMWKMEGAGPGLHDFDRSKPEKVGRNHHFYFQVNLGNFGEDKLWAAKNRKILVPDLNVALKPAIFQQAHYIPGHADFLSLRKSMTRHKFSRVGLLSSLHMSYKVVRGIPVTSEICVAPKRFMSA